MARPVQDTVHFKVTVQSYDRGGHWVAKAVETGIFTYGSSRGEAEALNGEANEVLVRRMKQEGQRALLRFLKARGITYRIGGSGFPTTPSSNTAWETTARNELARAA